MYADDVKRKSIQGRNVRLDPFAQADVDEQYQSWLLDPDIAQFLVDARYQELNLEMLREYVRTRQNDPQSFFFKIVDLDGGEKIGTISLNTNCHQGIGSYGYILGEKKFWGSTHATEAIVALLDFAFNTLQLRRVTGSAFANNVPSRFNFRRLGFTQEGVAREHIVGIDGSFIDSIRYGILAREWAERAPLVERYRHETPRK